jgi:hypothetical protein
MPRNPYIREKFTRDLSFARQLAREYFERFPKDRYGDRGRELAPDPVSKYRVHDETAKGTERARLSGRPGTQNEMSQRQSNL